MSEQSVSSHQL